ncbi:glycosyltransferase family 4 protein [Candidatus Parcubacteria bacterium]|nr:glycosyltransferase family 4 protein [Candidatus Parcubacteria bacterium]
MKITIIIPRLKISGGVIILAIYAHYLFLLGHEVKIIMNNPVAWRRFLANLLKYKPNWMSDFKLKIIRTPEINEKYFSEADILMISTYRHANLIKNFSNKFGKKVYLIQHDERLYHGKSDEVAEAYKLPFKFIAVSTWVKERLKKDFNQDTELLLNTLDKNIFYPREIKRSDRDIRILMLHHTYEWKGAKEGMEIINDLKKKHNNIKLIMYGARQENVECDEYYYKPFGKETAELFSGCDVFLCPSWDEGFGLPSLEAMACGCALATYDNGGSRDFAFHNKTALVAERRNKKDLKEKLELLIKNSGLRKQIAKNGCQFVKEMPTWKEQAKKMELILQKLL